MKPALVMPDLMGLASETAFRRLARVDARGDLGLEWARPVLVGCDTRPGTVVRQHPNPGTELRPRADVVIRTAELDLASVRGPCEPDVMLGPVTGPDAEIARAFYRFAADPALGAPFTDEDLWVGIEGGPTAVHLGALERRSLSAWQLDTGYAERSGPFSALDIVAASGGYYELHEGIPGCFTGDEVPAELAGFRTITLTAPADTTGACMQWWGVTLFLDDHDQIAGVAIRIGSP